MVSYPYFWGIAKLVRQRVLIPLCVGSSPATPANAGVVELVDTLDLGSSAERRESSSLSSRTILKIMRQWWNR